MERANKLNRGLDRLLGIPLVRLTALIRKFPRIQRKKPQNIGIICLGAIGDLLILSVLTASLRRYLDNKGMTATRICLLTSKSNADAASLLPGIDEHQAFPVRNIASMLHYLRSLHLDILIDATQWARIGSILSNVSGAGLTVGFDTPKQFRATGYDIRVPHRADQHEYLNFLALGQALFPDFSSVVNFSEYPHLCVPESLGNGELASFTGSEWIYLHMWPSGTMSFFKEWPQEYWAQLAKTLLERGFRLCLSGDKRDVPRTEAFLQRYFPKEKSEEKRIVSLAGKSTLPDLAWLLSHARAMVSVNTGIMHLAALCGVQTIGLHGSVNPLRWGPIGPAVVSLLPHQGDFAYLNLGFEYPQNVVSSMPFLPVEDVLAALEKVGVLS